MASDEPDNVFCEDLLDEQTPKPSILVIFGASGDLTQRKLIPALYSLAHDGLLPAGQTIIGVARSDFTSEEFRKAMREACDLHARRSPVSEAIWETFAEGLHYVSGELDDDSTFATLESMFDRIDAERGTEGRRIYYLAIPPAFFPQLATKLGEQGLVSDPESGAPSTRIIIEKPFGRDLASAQQLNAIATSIFRERQVFRIDHYLGKETVQNILVLRFANGIFEPFWNRQFIDHVQLTVAESIGVEDRGAYFDGAGMARDMVQNHMLQLLALVAMEPPAIYSADAVRDEKVKVFTALRELPAEDPSSVAVRGQYGEGSVGGVPSAAYRSEARVPADSRTETFAAIRTWVDNWRWAGVPFYLRAGKRLPKRSTTISIHFRPAPHPLFRKREGIEMRPNILAIRIQPDEGISLRFESKIPGPSMKSHPVTMEFRHATSFGAEPPEAYERLLLDTMAGDATLFARRDEVEWAWWWLDPLLESWASKGSPAPYEAGTWGPAVADELIRRDGREWRRL